KAVLFIVGHVPSDYENASIAVISLADHEKKILLDRVGMYARYVTGGYLTYVSGNTLFAAPFDAERLEVLGPSKPVLEGVVNQPAIGYAQADFSGNGMLLYHKGRNADAGALAWVDRAGEVAPLPVAPSLYAMQVRVSPDGDRVATNVVDGPNGAIWVYDS